MAKSKSGGTRSYLRGRIANDVYSIGKDAKGKKQQVVRALAESVENPRTEAQMRGRMIMSTVMQFLSGFSQILDHAFDGVPAGQPSLSEFIRDNYKLVAADAVEHPASGNAFQFIEYGQKAVPAGPFLISKGAVPFGSSIQTSDNTTYGPSFTGHTSGQTVAQFFAAHGLSYEDYITGVVILSTGLAGFYRLHPNTAVDGATVISEENASTLFTVEDPFGLDVKTSFTDGLIIVGTKYECKSVGVILSKKVGSGYEHSTSHMVNGLTYTPAPAADVALLTYPIGQERFLNGGDL